MRLSERRLRLRRQRLFGGRLDVAPALCALLPVFFLSWLQSYLIVPAGTRLSLAPAGHPAAWIPGQPTKHVAIDAYERFFVENQMVDINKLKDLLSAWRGASTSRTGGVAQVSSLPPVVWIEADQQVRQEKLNELLEIVHRAGILDVILVGSDLRAERRLTLPMVTPTTTP